jgi:hypothetical protein
VFDERTKFPIFSVVLSNIDDIIKDKTIIIKTYILLCLIKVKL